MSMRSPRALLRRACGAAVVVVLVAGCSSGSPLESPETPSQEQSPESAESAESAESMETASPSGTGTSPSEEAVEDASPTVAPEHPDPTESASPLPTWDTAATERAQERAVAFVRALVRTDLSEQDWYAGIRGFLSEEAQEKYRTVDPRNVPSTEITGEAALVDDSSVFLAIVEVPTAAGVFAVTVSRSEANQDWAVERAELLG